VHFLATFSGKSTPKMRALKFRVVQQHFLTTHFEGIEAKQTHLTTIAIYCRSSSSK